MAGLSIHIVVYAVVNAVLIGVWMVQGGATEELRAVTDDPLQAFRDGFWPGWVMAGWAPALALHLGIWLSLAVFGRKARRRRHALARAAMGVHRRHHDPDVPPVATPPTRPAGRQWVAAMFTDIAGSTGLAETLGDDAWHEMLADHRKLVRACVSHCGGTEVGTQGDGFLVRFDSPTAAVECATAVQQRIAAARRSGAFAPRLRIAIHAGEAVHDDDGDLVGRVVNLAARVLTFAQADEILVTEPVADHVPPSVRLVDRGLQPLRGISQPRHLLAVGWNDEPADGRRTISLDDAEPDRA